MGAREIRVEKEEWVCSGRSKRRKFEALNCFLKLSSSTRTSPSFFILVSHNFVPVPPFAFHFGMFNISFPYRSYKHVRQRWRRRGWERLVERSRAAKRVAMRKKTRQRTRKGRKTVLLVDNQLPPSPLLSLILPLVFALEAINDAWKRSRAMLRTYFSIGSARPSGVDLASLLTRNSAEKP